MSSVIKVGRGGAGNYHEPDEFNRDTAEDIESQRPPPSSRLESDPRVATRPAPEYAYSGRGGSGNIYSPKELEEQGTFQSPPAAPTTTDRRGSAGTAGFAGRGGAGNVRQRAVQVEDVELESQRDIEARLKEKVTQEVEAGLSAPPRVHLGRSSKPDTEDGALS